MSISKKPLSVLFIGGDKRQLQAIKRIAENGVETGVFGLPRLAECRFSEGISYINDISEISKYKILILPLPYSVDGKTINTMEKGFALEKDLFLQSLSKDSIVLAGKCDRNFSKAIESKGCLALDYLEREELKILNAVPTAEGAIQIAMEEVPFTIHSSKCLIIGNGRIGKILAKILNAMGADVTVAARKSQDRALVFTFGLKGISITDVYENIGKFDLIFNTVPKLIIDADMLSKIGKRTLVIDLASVPGGVDFEAARKMGVKVIWALSLPGKVAPDTAGDIIGKTILNILDELEVN